jgi:hypothetical protein
MDPGIVNLDKVEIPSGYDIHSSPWKDPPCLIGKPSVSIRAIYWQGHRIPELWGQNFGSIQTRRASWPNHSCGFGVESVSQLGDPGRKNTLKSVINRIDCTQCFFSEESHFNLHFCTLVIRDFRTSIVIFKAPPRTLKHFDRCSFTRFPGADAWLSKIYLM